MENEEMYNKIPPIQHKITWSDLGNGIYNLSSPPAAFQEYLTLGETHALLVDTGLGIGSLKQAVQEITGLPVMVINTHGHPDHVGGNAEFPPALMCPEDFDVYERMGTFDSRSKNLQSMPGQSAFIPMLQPDPIHPLPVYDGQTLDLGRRTLQVIYAPGHTHGSICIYEKETGVLFSGDNILENTTLNEWNSSTIKTFHNTLQRLNTLKLTCIMGGHKPNINSPELLNKLIYCVQDILNGAHAEKKTGWDGIESLNYEKDGVSISYAERNLGD